MLVRYPLLFRVVTTWRLLWFTGVDSWRWVWDLYIYTSVCKWSEFWNVAELLMLLISNLEHLHLLPINTSLQRDSRSVLVCLPLWSTRQAGHTLGGRLCVLTISGDKLKQHWQVWFIFSTAFYKYLFFFKFIITVTETIVSVWLTLATNWQRRQAALGPWSRITETRPGSLQPRANRCTYCSEADITISADWEGLKCSHSHIDTRRGADLNINAPSARELAWEEEVKKKTDLSV